MSVSITIYPDRTNIVRLDPLRIFLTLLPEKVEEGRTPAWTLTAVDLGERGERAVDLVLGLGELKVGWRELGGEGEKT